MGKVIYAYAGGHYRVVGRDGMKVVLQEVYTGKKIKVSGKMFAANNIIEIQPTVPVVYGEPIEFEDLKPERKDDELISFVNRHADRAYQAKRRKIEVRRKRVVTGINLALFFTVTFFTTVGITTVFHWIFG